MTLLALQQSFRAYLQDGPNDLPSHVTAGAAAGLAVYHHAYRAQLQAALRDSFEKTRAWLGDEAFDMAASAHVVAAPPSSWTLGHYGRDFPETLDRIYPHDLEVGELARLDWALRRAFDGKDAEPVSSELFASVDWTSAGIELAPTLSVLNVTTNAAALWSAMAEGEVPPPAQRLAEPASVRVWRKALSPRFTTMDHCEAEALGLLLAGSSFSVMCEVVAARFELGVVGQLVGGWLRDELIVGIAHRVEGPGCTRA